MNEIIRQIAVNALPILFAITLYEAARGYVAYYLGDKTGYMMGRISLNPAKHIDPVGTIFLPLISFSVAASTGLPFFMGYAKPILIDYGKLRNPKRDKVLLACAGPAANFSMALLWLILLEMLKGFHINQEYEFFLQVANAGVWINLMFFALNLLPLPPLEGGRILIGLLPHKYASELAKIEPYGFLIVMALAMTNILFNFWIGPLMFVTGKILHVIIFPLIFLLS